MNQFSPNDTLKDVRIEIEENDETQENELANHLRNDYNPGRN